MRAPRIFFYVQYLEGIGHVVRASRIAAALVRQGAQVTLALGGEPVRDLALPPCAVVELPPLRATPDSYSKLLRPDDRPADPVYEAARRETLLAAFADATPDVLITEGYPFARWAMEFELGPLLDAATGGSGRRPMIVASLRDILQMPKAPDKAARSVEIYRRHFDAMLVHGDPRLAKIEDSFPPLAPFARDAHYTGIVAPEPPRHATTPAGERFDVVVTGGGGAIAYDVLRAAIEAKPVSHLAGAHWLALAGPRMADTEFASLGRAAARHDVRLERFRQGLPNLLRAARLSIQRAGYNTVADLLVAGCRGVLVPDSANRQREQPLRAERLQSLGRAVVVAEATLSPETMAAGIDKAIAAPPGDVSLDLDGAEKAAGTLIALLDRYERGKLGGERPAGG